MSIASSISSIGHICATLNRPYQPIRKAIETLGITPAVVINCVAHYSDEDVDAIREHLDQTSEGQH